jgi:hypothetical protein
VQDDWRLNSKFTLNYGLRIEREDGIREVNNNFTVGFDRTATSALSSVVIPGSIDPLGGSDRRPLGGLMYAGVNGNKEYQGDPPKAKLSPRIGAVYSLNSKTVVGGYGLYWSPWNYPVPSATSNNGNYGQIGFTNTPRRRSLPARRPYVRQPVPERARAALRQHQRHQRCSAASAPTSRSSIRTAPHRGCSSSRSISSASWSPTWP